MSSLNVSRRYARALFELHQEGVKGLSDGLAKLAAVVAVAEVKAVLEAPQVPAGQKSAMLTKAAGSVSKELERLALLLCERNKAVLLPEISELFEAMVRDASETLKADVVVAAKLDAKAQEKLAAAVGKLLGRKVSLDVSVDSNIVGGMVVNVGDRQIDHSVRGKLEGLRKALAA